ncbi:MAG: cytochrome c family protein [Pirellulaceae bacterium]
MIRVITYSFHSRSRRISRHTIIQCVLVGAVGLVVTGTSAAETPGSAAVSTDPHKVKGVESCVKCHENEVKQWKNTPHAQTFDTLHRRPEAKQIAERMGVRSIKRGDVCIECHYTQQAHEDGKIKAISGVSCESCHGAANDWLAIHNDYGGENVPKSAETAEHRARRMKQSINLGMRNPVNLYLVARSCFDCHTTPNEKLVNVGGHSAGSKDFELVSWSQGMVRHNFLRTEGKANAPSSPDRIRVMFVVGLMTDLEYSLRATALATEKSTFGLTSAKRAATVRKKLTAIQQHVNNPQLERALAAVNSVKLKLNNREELEAAAAVVGESAYEFAETQDGTRLSAIDPIVPPPNAYRHQSQR